MHSLNSSPIRRHHDQLCKSPLGVAWAGALFTVDCPTKSHGMSDRSSICDGRSPQTLTAPGPSAVQLPGPSREGGDQERMDALD